MRTRTSAVLLFSAALLFAAVLLWSSAMASAGPAPAAPAEEPAVPPAAVLPAKAAELGSGAVYCVVEIPFAGPAFGPTGTPAKDVELRVRFRHESGAPTYEVLGFWDGDGKGGTTGNVFKVRFCPTKAGRWLLAEVRSNHPALAGQREGNFVTVIPSGRKGFWTVDASSPGGRWYQRSDGSHAYVFGNTHYSFLSERGEGGPTGSSIAADVAANAKYFNKLRFSIHADRYPHPTDKPFLDNTGRPTDDGDYCHRPNPAWFLRRVDAAVQAAFDYDLIADLILNGPDTQESRSALRAAQNGGDPTPFLRYIAARYGSYPNVWLCLSNEWDIKSPAYMAPEIRRFGWILKRCLPYPTPLSIHRGAGDWNSALNTEPPWNDHVIVQGKIRALAESAEFLVRNHALGGGAMPVINDELGYQGEDDGFSAEDVIEGHLGAFLGGGYATTGYKPANKKGQYFWGRFTAAEHTAAANLAWLRKRIDANITFWKMKPVAPAASIFPNAGAKCRAMEWPDNEYVLGTCEEQADILVRLPPGVWQAMRFDAIAQEEVSLGSEAVGLCAVDAPASRAVLFHFKKRLSRPAAAGKPAPGAEPSK